MKSDSRISDCELDDSCYFPYAFTISAGKTVKWFNADSVSHTVTSGNFRDGPDGLFNSELLSSGKYFEQTLIVEGTYPYFCMVHPWMNGKIIVIPKDNYEYFEPKDVEIKKQQM